MQNPRPHAGNQGNPGTVRVNQTTQGRTVTINLNDLNQLAANISTATRTRPNPNLIPAPGRVDRRLTRRVVSRFDHPLLRRPRPEGPFESYVELKMATWRVPYFDLFHFKTRDHHYDSVQIGESRTLRLVQNRLQSDNQTGKCEATICVEKRQGEFYLKRPNPPSKEQFVVVQSLRDKTRRAQRGYCLLPGSLIRLGSFRMRVTELALPLGPGNQLTTKRAPDEGALSLSTVDITEQVRALKARRESGETEDGRSASLTCKYCLMESIADDPTRDLLVHLCRCKGGSKYTHIFCLQNWMKQKVERSKNDAFVIYDYSNLKCEICKAPWPRRLRLADRLIDVVDVQRPKVPYVMLETQEKAPKKRASKILCILANRGQAVTLGKRYSATLHIDCESVSAVHAAIRYERRHFWLFDNESRFGTLVRMDQDWKIDYHKFAVQVGRSVVSCLLKDKRPE